MHVGTLGIHGVARDVVSALVEPVLAFRSRGAHAGETWRDTHNPPLAYSFYWIERSRLVSAHSVCGVSREAELVRVRAGCAVGGVARG